MSEVNGYFYLNKKEEQVMKVLWNSNKPLSITEIKELVGADWAKTSIQSVVRKLESKGAIKVAKITKICKTYGRLFCPTISLDEYAIMHFENLYSNDKFIPFILSALLDEKNRTPELINDLEEIIKKYKEE